MAQTAIVRGGQVWDGRAFVAGPAIVARDGVIVELLRGGALPDETAADVIDADGLFLLPGLIDSHCHLMTRSLADPDDRFVARSTLDAVEWAGRMVRAGVTTVRDAGSRTRAIEPIKEAIASGRIAGPRVVAAGVNLTGSAAPRAWRNRFADGCDGMRRAVRDLYRTGAADWLKLILSHAPAELGYARVVPFLSAEEISAAVAEAHDLGLRVGCHCEGVRAARAAVAAGMDVIDHGTGIDAELARAMAARGVVLVPTLWAFSAATRSGYAGDIPADALPAYVEHVERRHRDAFACAVAAGVVIAAGSDAMVPVPDPDLLVREALALHDAGLGADEVIAALTVNGARALGRDGELGRLAVGHRADIAGFDADPRADLRTLSSPALVVKDGLRVA